MGGLTGSGNNGTGSERRVSARNVDECRHALHSRHESAGRSFYLGQSCIIGSTGLCPLARY